MEILQQIVFGIVQGIVEWLPFSSEGTLLLIQSNFFGTTELEPFIRQALFLHLGTFFAALIYFRKDVINMIKGAWSYDVAETETRKMLKFIVMATLISGVVGLAILQLFRFIDLQETILFTTSKTITFFIGLLLLATGFLQITSKRNTRGGYRTIYHLKNSDGIFLGLVQGLATLPGLSRSGLTVSSFLLRNFDETNALRLSFIMSLPIVLLGNIVLNLHDFVFVEGMLVGLLFSFIFGFATIHVLMRFSEKVRFGHFVLFMAILMILSSFLR